MLRDNRHWNVLVWGTKQREGTVRYYYEICPLSTRVKWFSKRRYTQSLHLLLLFLLQFAVISVRLETQEPHQNIELRHNHGQHRGVICSSYLQCVWWNDRPGGADLGLSRWKSLISTGWNGPNLLPHGPPRPRLYLRNPNLPDRNGPIWTSGSRKGKDHFARG